jgi:hypothetical protein
LEDIYPGWLAVKARDKTRRIIDVILFTSSHLRGENHASLYKTLYSWSLNLRKHQDVWESMYWQ